MTARKLSGFLSEPASGLARLTREAKRLLALSQVWEAIAPPALARSVRVGPVRDGVLTLFADNGAAAAKLKQQLPRLLSSFRQRGHDLTGITVQVQVTTPSWSPRKTVSRPPIPPAALAGLRALEQELAPSPLKRALTNLLRHQTQETAPASAHEQPPQRQERQDEHQ